MRLKKNKVYLSTLEQEKLEKIVNRGKHSATQVKRANILLQLNENQPCVKTQAEIAKICHSNTTTVRAIAAKFVDVRLEVLNNKKRETQPIKAIVTGEVEAHIIAINCSTPPEGYSRWTLELTAKKLIELKIVPAISTNTVGRALKKRIKTASE